MQAQQQRAQALQHHVGASDRAFVRESWTAEGLRIDGRRPQQLRDLTVEFPFPGERNHALVTLGETIVSAAVGCRLVEPSPFGAKNGFFDINVHMPDAQPSSARSPVALDVRHALDALFKTAGAVDTESLCVVPGRYVWSLSVTVTVLSDAGNAVDVACWATIAALRHARRPELTISNDRVVLHTVKERTPVPLSLHHHPIAVSAAVMEGGGVVVDPSLPEAAAASSVLTVALTPSMQICAVHKRGGAPCDYPVVQGVIALAKSLVTGVEEVMTKAMAEDEEKRKAAQRAQFEWARKRSGVAAAPKS